MTSKNALYERIDELPVKRWFEILKTGDLKYLFKSGKGRVTRETHELWLDIEQQYYDEFGVDIEFQVRMDRIKQLIILQCDFIETGDRKKLARINILEHELRDVGEQHEVKMYDIKDRLEQIRGYQIDLNKVTVIEWYYMIKNVPKKPKEGGSHGED